MKVSATLVAVLLSICSAFAQLSSPDSLAQSWSAGPSWFQFFKVLLVLALVLGLIWISLAGLKKLTRKAGSGLRGVEVVGGVPLGPRRSLIFVRIGASLHVIGATDHHLSSIAVISDPSEVALIESGGLDANQPSFSAILRKFTGKAAGETGAPGA